MLFLPPLFSAISIGIFAYLVAEKLTQFGAEKRSNVVALPIMFKIFLPMVPQFLPYIRRPVFVQWLKQTARLNKDG